MNSKLPQDTHSNTAAHFKSAFIFQCPPITLKKKRDLATNINFSYHFTDCVISQFIYLSPTRDKVGMLIPAHK